MSKTNRLPFLLEKLGKLYECLPGVPCAACGECCVSPTVTLLEFIYLMDGLIAQCSKEELTQMLCRAPQFHATSEGNLLCRIQNKGLCAIHTSRTMACRLHGLPVLSLLEIAGQENCGKMKEGLPDVDPKELHSWLSLLTELNGELISPYGEPYWLAGLNLECWLAVYYDPLLDAGPFGEAKEILCERYPQLGEIPYEDKTKLKEKVDKITLLFEMVKVVPSEGLSFLVDSITADYPLTGTYYLEESKKIRKVLAGEEKEKPDR